MSLTITEILISQKGFCVIYSQKLGVKERIVNNNNRPIHNFKTSLNEI